jgi:histidyl-tRNA synthetase
VDVLGSSSLIHDAEMVQIYDEVFAALDLTVRIRINHRKILTGLAAVAGVPDKAADMTIAIDKWDRIGPEGVKEELRKKGFSDEACATVLAVMDEHSLDGLSKLLKASPEALDGILEVRDVLRYLDSVQLTNAVEFDIRLARGMDYYTGCIYEVESTEVNIGSVGGGGRYDELTSVFGMKEMPCTGVSFGAERIYDVMESLGKFPATLRTAPQILFIPLDKEALSFAFTVAADLRRHGVSAAIYPEPAKLQKQMRYANQLGVAFVGIIGETEIRQQSVMVKEMQSGEQTLAPVIELAMMLNS